MRGCGLRDYHVPSSRISFSVDVSVRGSSVTRKKPSRERSGEVGRENQQQSAESFREFVIQLRCRSGRDADLSGCASHDHLQATARPVWILWAPASRCRHSHLPPTYPDIHLTWMYWSSGKKITSHIETSVELLLSGLLPGY